MLWFLHQLLDEESATRGRSTLAGNREPSAVSQEDLEDTVLHNTNQFYKWHAELEAAFISETEEKYRQYASELQGRLQRCTDIHDKARLNYVASSIQTLTVQTASCVCTG